MDKAKEHLSVAAGLIFALLVIGTIAFHFIEGWSYIDSFYFTSMTITTVGYGDLVPSHDLSKIFASFFALIAIGIALFAFSVIAKYYLQKREEWIEKVIEKKIAKKRKTDF